MTSAEGGQVQMANSRPLVQSKPMRSNGFVAICFGPGDWETFGHDNLSPSRNSLIPRSHDAMSSRNICLGEELLAVVILERDNGVEHVKRHAVQAFLDASLLHICLCFFEVRNMF